MTIELDWHEGDENPAAAWDEPSQPSDFAPQPTQTIAKSLRPHSRVSLGALALAAVILVLGAAMAAAVLYLRANRGSELARQDIERTIVQLLEARQEGDIAVMSSLVDPSTPSQGRELLDDPAAPGTLSVSSVTLQGSQAIAELRQALADDDIQRRWAFFRLTDGRWLLAQPDPDAFGEPQVNESPHFRLHYRAQDEPLARDLINLAEGSYVTLCGEFRCRNSNRLLTLNLLYDGDQVPAAQPGSVDLPSPWLAGVTEDGEPHRAWEQLLVRQLARSLALSRLPTASPGLVDALGDWATVSVAGVPDESRELLRAAIQTGELPPLARAWDEVVLPGRHGDPLTAAQVQSMLTFLEDSAGERGIGDLLDAMARSPDRLDLADLLRRGVGTDLAPFEAAWMRWLEEDTSAGASSAETG